MPHLPVFPDHAAFPSTKEDQILATGLTKREFFAALVMAGMYANSNPVIDNLSVTNASVDERASDAVDAADALIKALSDNS